MLKIMILSCMVDKQAFVASVEMTNIESESGTVEPVHYKLSVEKSTQVSRHRAVKELSDEKRTQECRTEVQVLDKYLDFCEKFIDLPSEFRSMWDGHLGQVNIEKYQIMLSRKNT